MAESPDDEAASPTEDETEESLTELVERLVRETSTLALYEARLAASRHKPALLETAQGVAAALAVGLVLLTAFALANAAAVLALSPSIPDWLAALVLAVGWSVVGALIALLLWRRARRITGWKLEDAEQARAEAEQAVRLTLEQLAPAISREIALAALPVAGGMAGGLVDAGGDMIEGADDLIEAITEDVPGGGVVNQIWDVVLMPGRFGVRVATTVLKRGDAQGPITRDS
jgi:Putative Actinobacterial Holin-X, holin superfamily III